MPTYQVTRNWSGYSRGATVYSVEADSPEQAKEIYDKGEEVCQDTYRDNTETDNLEVTQI